MSTIGIVDPSDRVQTGGRGLLALAWAVACLPSVVLYVGVATAHTARWEWDALPTLVWACPATACACAVALTWRETTIWKKVLGWFAFALSLGLKCGLQRFRGI